MTPGISRSGVGGHHILHDLAGARRVGDGRAAHAGEDDGLQHVDLRKPAAEAPDQRVAEGHEPFRHRADVHQFGGKDEQRHGKDDVVYVHPVQELFGGGAHVEPGQPQIENGAGDHRVTDRQAKQRQSGDGDDRQRKRTGEVHTPDPALVGSNSSGAEPRSTCQQSQT